MSTTSRSAVAVSIIALVVFSFTASAAHVSLNEGPSSLKRSKSITKQKAVTPTERSHKSEEKVVKEDVHYSVFRNIPPAYEVKKRRNR